MAKRKIYACAVLLTGLMCAQAASAKWDPSVLNVYWSSQLTAIGANEINVKTDSRLAVRAVGDGKADDTAAVRAAIALAASKGGGTVYFPAGNYRLVTPSGATKGSPVSVPSKVILRGESTTGTRLLVNDAQSSQQTDGIWTWGGLDFRNASYSGITDMSIYAVTASTAPCALLWNRGTQATRFVFFNKVYVDLGTCKAAWFEKTDTLLVQDSTITSDSTKMGPMFFTDNLTLTLLRNEILYKYGRVDLHSNTGLRVESNRITRDPSGKTLDNGNAIESGGVELSFSQRVQMVYNTITTLNVPNNASGDGEAIMSQHSTFEDIMDAGSLTSATATTLTDTSALWGAVTAKRFITYPGTVVILLSGPQTGQWRRVKSIDTARKTLTLESPWNSPPAAGTQYSLFRWTLAEANISRNTLVGNPNGIIIYSGCYRCRIDENTLTDSRGIQLRVVDEALNKTTYPESRRVHEVAMDVQILANKVSNNKGIRPAYIAVDVEAFHPENYKGMGMMNINVGYNAINTYTSSVNKLYTSVASQLTQEGLYPCFYFGPARSKDPITTVMKGVYISKNTQNKLVSYISGLVPYASTTCATTVSAITKIQ